MGDLAKSVGWNKAELIQKLESKRQERASEYYQRKVNLEKNIKQEVEKLSEVQKLREELKQYGY